MVFIQIGKSDDFACGDYKILANGFYGEFLPLFKGKRLTSTTDTPCDFDSATSVCEAHLANFIPN